MRQEYADIVSRLGPPLWWDEYSAPRYEPFDPRMCNNIYASEACLLEIACQQCGETFMVAASSDKYSEAIEGHPAMSVEIRGGWIHWGDPPFHDCVGSTMNCEDLRVVEFWSRDRLDWQRVPELEVVLQDHWSGEDE
jgi:hypothetical protein